MQKLIRSTLSLLLLSGMFVTTLLPVQATEISPRYIGLYTITSSLTISSNGQATCKGSARSKSGYTADLTLELKRDGTVIKTWTTSGSGSLKIDESYFVTSGHDYDLVATATVYDSSGKLVETPSSTSSKSY